MIARDDACGTSIFFFFLFCLKLFAPFPLPQLQLPLVPGRPSPRVPRPLLAAGKTFKNFHGISELACQMFPQDERKTLEEFKKNPSNFVLYVPLGHPVTKLTTNQSEEAATNVLQTFNSYFPTLCRRLFCETIIILLISVRYV